MLCISIVLDFRQINELLPKAQSAINLDLRQKYTEKYYE